MATSTGVYWVGADGNYYAKTSAGVQNIGSSTGEFNPAQATILNGLSRINDPMQAAPTQTVAAAPVEQTAAEKQAAQDAIDRVALQGSIAGKAGAVDSTYNDLFGSVNSLVTARDGQLETQYGDQFKKASNQYADAIPQIETSYAAIGAADSTDNTYAKVGAKKGFEDTTKTIGNNKAADKVKLGQYKTEQDAKISADKQTAQMNISKAPGTTDVNALRSMNNELDSSLINSGVTKATLGTDGAASKTVSDLTADGGRYDAAVNALDGILKSSLSGSVKEAAVKAVTDSSGLSDQEKAKVQQTYGNVYAEQSAL